MKDCVIISLAIGMIAGALIATNSEKIQSLMKKGKEAVNKEIKKLK